MQAQRTKKTRPLKVKPGLGTKIKSGPPQSDEKNDRQNDKKDDLPEERLYLIEID